MAVLCSTTTASSGSSGYGPQSGGGLIAGHKSLEGTVCWFCRHFRGRLSISMPDSHLNSARLKLGAGMASDDNARCCHGTRRSAPVTEPRCLRNLPTARTKKSADWNFGNSVPLFRPAPNVTACSIQRYRRHTVLPCLSSPPQEATPLVTPTTTRRKQGGSAIKTGRLSVWRRSLGERMRQCQS
jgi:hypothetical protein